MSEIITVPIRLEGKAFRLIQQIADDTHTNPDDVASVVCWLALRHYGLDAERVGPLSAEQPE
jgi:hypothetical protein